MKTFYEYIAQAPPMQQNPPAQSAPEILRQRLQKRAAGQGGTPTQQTQDAKAAAEIRDEKEQDELAQAYGKGATGRGMASGGSKALKELEKEQKTRTTRMVRDSLDAALLDIATLYRDIMMVQSGHIDALINLEMAQEINAIASVVPTHKTIQRLDAVMKARKALGFNAAPLLTIEALMCELV